LIKDDEEDEEVEDGDLNTNETSSVAGESEDTDDGPKLNLEDLMNEEDETEEDPKSE